MREINEIVIHCLAVSPTWKQEESADAVVAEVTRWHKDKGWSDCGYHYIVHTDGSVATARPIERAGAHVRGRNKHSIGISLTGGRGGCADDDFLDNYTPEQEKALRELVDDLVDTYGIETVSAHHQYANKACPCFSVKDWY